MFKVYSAGVAKNPATKTMNEFKERYGETDCQIEFGGSVAGINRFLTGEDFDILILADSSNVDQMLMPEYADGYFIWAGNEIVIAGNDINDDNWKEKLLNPASVIKHKNPYDDPCGYRGVMAMKLADKVEEGLSNKLFNHRGYNGLDRDEYISGVNDPLKDGEYKFVYKSMYKNFANSYASLPREMSLGDSDYEDVYKTATFIVDGGAEVCGTAITHAIVIPKATKNIEKANEFVSLFLQNDFESFGFNKIQTAVGNWNV